MACDAPHPDHGALARLESLRDGRVALVSGASGCGKSTLLRALIESARARGQRVETVGAGAFSRSRRPAIEVVGGSLETALGAMGSAGLGEAALLAREARRLSEGERWRLTLAKAMVGAHAGRGRAWVIADEFCSTLDRATAESVAVCVRRWASRRPGVRVVCATAHEDMAGLLRPDLHVHVSLEGEAQVVDGRPRRRGIVRIEEGAIEDYDALGDRHYRGGRPATWTRVLRAWRRTVHGRLLAGVLVVSRPTLNAAWRDQPWPGRYTTGSLRARAHRINRELRCISRVVVEPRSRGMGIARRLVEAYLDNPQTPATEALAAMGAVCPFFERSGMRAYRVGIRRADARLEDALAHAGFSPDELLVGERADDAARDAFVRRELRRWANVSRATRGVLGESWGQMARAAGARLAARAIGYAHVVGGM
ncbi:MAG: hypothetical protein R3B57_06630 [Phycisphaerales bacterium]